jgi:hypothetical protein
MRQRAAGDDQQTLAVRGAAVRRVLFRHCAHRVQCTAVAARRAAINPLAVSTATAASRQ